MAVPKKRTSKSQRDQRRSHHALTPEATSICTNCRAKMKPHNICQACGYYRGRQMVKV